MTSRPHDALFRSAFEHPADAAAELRHVLPPGLVAAIDGSSLRAEPGSYIDPELADRESDLLFSVAVDDARVLVYLLLEHQSEGVLDGLRAGLVKQLRLKYGSLDSAIVQRVEQASAEDIDRWLERVLVADTLDAVIER